MAKTTKVKWSIGAEEPDDLQDFLSNDEIVEKNTTGKGKNAEINWPGKGPFTLECRGLKVKENRSGDDRISVMQVIKEKDKNSEAYPWNGYVVWDGLNVSDQGKSFVKRWLKSMGISWKDFIENTKKEGDKEPYTITQIGRVKFNGSKPPTYRATLRVAPPDDYNDEEFLEVARYLPAEGSDDGSDGDAGEPDEGTDVMSMDSGGDEGAADGEGATSDAEPWVRGDFDDDDFDTIAQVAVEDLGLKAKEFKALKKADDKEGLLDLMFGKPEPKKSKAKSKAKDDGKAKAAKAGTGKKKKGKDEPPF